ncbi:hypothetical protein ACFLQY_03960 [Verrucomicrobiota bacterium]
MDPLGIKAKRTLEIQRLIAEELEEHTKDIDLLKERDIEKQKDIQHLSEELEAQKEQTGHMAERVAVLEAESEQRRNSAIRGEIASGRKTKDVAYEYGVSASRVSQIAPRRRYNNG